MYQLCHCRRRHTADDAQDVQRSVCQDKATMNGSTVQQQQQRMIDMLQLRSDELSAENGKLRMQMTRADRQLPGQVQSDQFSSHMSGHQQNEYTPSRASMAMHQHASQAGGLSKGAPFRAAGQSQAGPALFIDRWDCTCTHRCMTQWAALAWLAKACCLSATATMGLCHVVLYSSFREYDISVSVSKMKRNFKLVTGQLGSCICLTSGLATYFVFQFCVNP